MRLPTGSSVATTGVRSFARPAREMGDMRRQVSWLTARTLPSAFPVSDLERPGPVAHVAEARRLQLRGQPRNYACPFCNSVARTGFPFSPDTACAAPEPSRGLCGQNVPGPSSAADLACCISASMDDQRGGSSTASLIFTTEPSGFSMPRAVWRMRRRSPLLKNVKML